MLRRIHIIGLPHLPVSEYYQTCAFTQKIIKLIKQCKMYNHEVYLYGISASDKVKTLCDKYFQVLPYEEFLNIEYINNLSGLNFMSNGNHEFNELFGTSAGKLVLENRRTLEDVVCITHGRIQKSVTDVTKKQVIEIESGIGYIGTYLNNRVYESYIWMHTIDYTGTSNGNSLWTVIPNCVDTDEEWQYSENKDNYLIFIGRLIRNKGVKQAIDAATKLKTKIVIIGQGNINEFVDKENIKYVEYLGVKQDIKEKSSLISKAKCMLVPTQYIEPFGTVHVESLYCGTPIITSDYGVFVETNIHGVTGYRYRLFDQLLECINNVDEISPVVCRKYAEDNFTLSVTAKQYDEYFKTLRICT